MSNFYDFIDKIIYINLDKRTDRKDEIEAEFKRLGIPQEKLGRMIATESTKKLPPSLACTQSHIEVLKFAKDMKYKNVLILEDDFNFIKSLEAINYYFNLFFTDIKEWDVLHLAHGYRFFVKFLKGQPDNYPIKRAHEVSTASGYLVNGHFYDKLISDFTDAYLGLKATKNYPKYALDVNWYYLQQNSNWFVFHPSLGYQRPSYSDIECKDVNYIEADNSLIGNI